MPRRIGSSSSASVNSWAARTSFSVQTRSRSVSPRTSVARVMPQMRAVPSSEAVATRLPSGLKPALRTSPVCPLSRAISLPLSASQMRAVLSSYHSQISRRARHHHLEHLVQDAVRIAAIRHRRRKPRAHTKLALCCAQKQQAAIGGLGAAVEIYCQFLAADGWQ
jgi:hypothetical protein